jgi:hypothetical protein
MLPFEDRYSRQRRLKEVGPDGQRRIEQAALAIAEHADGELERDYLARAGARQVSIDADAEALDFPWPQHFRFAASLAVARGAWCALSRLRTALSQPG